jgi:hypothetical protein
MYCKSKIKTPTLVRSDKSPCQELEKGRKRIRETRCKGA